MSSFNVQSLGAIVVGAGSCSGPYRGGSEGCGLCLAGPCIMRAGWFAFLDRQSELVSGCRRGGRFCIGGCGGGFAWLVGGVWVLRCGLCTFSCLGVAVAWCSGWWRGWGLRGLSLIHCESKFNLLSLSTEHLVHSHYVILYHFILEFYIIFIS